MWWQRLEIEPVAEVLLIHIDLVFKEICLRIGHGPKFDILCLPIGHGPKFDILCLPVGHGQSLTFYAFL